MRSEAIRALNPTGIRRFRAYLDALRAGEAADPPFELLTDPAATTPVDGAGVAEARPWKNRHEAAAHLSEVLADVDAIDLEDNVGLWSWLSLFHFDEVCPPNLGGIRKPGREYRHILEPGFLRGHRHLLAGALAVFRLHGDGAMLLLCSRVRTENTFHHELASRQNLITNSAVIEAASHLYLDRRKRRPKPGARRGRDAAGSLRRFVDVVQQLDLNYDLHSMSGDALLDLLPDEFRRWKPLRRRFRRKPKA